MDKKLVRRILVIRVDFLGDMVCTTPLLHALKLRWPQAEIHVLANNYNSAVLENNSDITRVYHYVYAKRHERNVKAGWFNYFRERCRLIYKLRKIKFDLLIIPNGTRNKKAINFARQLNVPDCRWHNRDTEFSDLDKTHMHTRPIIHEALAGFALVPELRCPDIDQLRLYVYPRQQLVLQWQHTFDKKSKPRVGLFVSNKHAERRWPWHKWQALIDELTEHCEIVIFHSPQETETFPPEWRAGAGVQRVSTHTVAELIAVMTYLDVVVSADSAPVHLASALQISVVALFESSPAKYQRWYPLGFKYILIHQGKSVADISVESVCSATMELLKSGHFLV